jgi:tetratricopeptide (TPR) repeat protein
MIHSAPRTCAVLVSIAGLLTACASSGQTRPDLALAGADSRAAGVAALRRGAPAEALAPLAAAVADRPLDPVNQTLLGLAYQSSDRGAADSRDLAVAGYDLALRAEPGQFWAASLAGRAAFDQGQYDRASSRFAEAVLARPDDARALYALAASAYMNGDAALAAAAADRAAQKDPDPRYPRLAAFAYAAMGEGDLARQRLSLTAAPGADSVRLAQLAQTSPADLQPNAGAPTAAAVPGTAAGAPVEPAAPNQVSVDVAIVLAQNTQRDQVGMNLLDGLRLQYGYSNQVTETRSSGLDTFQRAITEAISVPQLNYNLNIFNRTGQFYQVVARPTLTAYRGETSEFFVGRTLKVAVSGVNSGILEQIDIGIELKVTPIEITGDRVRVRIETGRSFLSGDLPGNFAESLATFRQKVAATAEIRFGETLVLSGLSESVDDSTFSRTPLLGDAPIAGSLFNARNRNSRRDSVLILVTPAPATFLPGRAWARPEGVERLVSLWTQVIDPSSNGVDVAARLRKARLFSRMSAGDAPLAWPDARRQTGEILKDLVLPGL